ncbi:MAG: type II toxin-antitoxin system Phd/YefM family antitoxin, partial [Chloroflexota bacterium]
MPRVSPAFVARLETPRPSASRRSPPVSMAATDSRLVRPTCVGLMRYAWSVTTRRYKSIGVYQAKTHLPQLIDEISDGQTTVVITRYGTPVAVLEAPAGGPKGQDPV